jgi:nucleoside triphosphatase
MIQKYPEPTVGALIFNNKDELFLIKSHKWNNKYVLAGGHIEFGESFNQALKREIKEETNLDIDDIKFLTLHNAISPKEFYKNKHFIFLNFICRTKNTDNIKLNKEAQDFIWIKPEEALKLDLEEYTRKSIEIYLEK